MATQIKVELFKLVRKGRSYIGFVALALLAVLMVIGMAHSRRHFHGAPPGFVMVGNPFNAAFVTWTLLKAAVSFFLPLFACVVVGDILSSETSEGTLRTMLSKSIGRASLFSSKFAVSAIYVVVLTFFMGLFAYTIGAIFLGHGPLVTLENGSRSMSSVMSVSSSEADAIARLAGAYALTCLAALAVASIAFLISVFVANSLASVLGAMAVLIVFQIIGMFDFFKPIHYYLFTKHMDTVDKFFGGPIPWAEVGKSAAVFAGYVVVSFTVGLIAFRRKDILS